MFRSDYLLVPLAVPQRGCPVAMVYPEVLWGRYTLLQKLRFLVAREWVPTESELASAARGTFLDELFGSPDDLGEVLLEVMTEHWQTTWQFDHMTEHDRKRADALMTYTLETRQRFRGFLSSPALNLQFLRRTPLLCAVVMPMLMKIPVTSLQYFLDIHVHFAFNEIRRSGHPQAEQLIGLLYETLFLQQKIAVMLKQLMEHIARAFATKGESLFIGAELDAILAVDLLFVYEKASIEKTMALVGHTLGVQLEEKKTHKKRLAALNAALPENARLTPYGQLLLEFVSSDALEELNTYRSGLLHKRGIAELQPHNYVGVPREGNAFRKLLGILHEQHAKNTAVLLSALALLTDDLLQRVAPHHVPHAVINPPTALTDALRESIGRPSNPVAPSGEAG